MSMRARVAIRTLRVERHFHPTQGTQSTQRTQKVCKKVRNKRNDRARE